MEDRKYPLAILYDISISPVTMKFLKELPFRQGLLPIYNLKSDEPVCVALIFDALCKDVVIRN